MVSQIMSKLFLPSNINSNWFKGLVRKRMKCKEGHQVEKFLSDLPFTHSLNKIKYCVKQNPKKYFNFNLQNAGKMDLDLLASKRH